MNIKEKSDFKGNNTEGREEIKEKTEEKKSFGEVGEKEEFGEKKELRQRKEKYEWGLRGLL